MKPPICTICNKRFKPSEKQGLIRFKLSEKDKEFNKKFEEKGFVGHKAGEDWFCETHYKVALKYKHLSLTEAYKQIKKDIQNSYTEKG